MKLALLGSLALSLTACDGGAPPAAPAPGDAALPARLLRDTGGRMPDCDAYVAKVESYIHCEQVSWTARRGALQGMDAVIRRWDLSRMTTDEIRQANDACKQAIEGTGQGASNPCWP